MGFKEVAWAETTSVYNFRLQQNLFFVLFVHSLVYENQEPEVTMPFSTPQNISLDFYFSLF